MFKRTSFPKRVYEPIIIYKLIHKNIFIYLFQNIIKHLHNIIHRG
jgi:hypothetical protein